MAIVKTEQVDKLNVKVYQTREEMGRAAAEEAAAAIRAAIAAKGEINMIFAAAPSQNEFLAHLIADKSIDFTKINAFHMDEYIGLPADAPQRFGTFLSRAIFDRKPFCKVHLMNSGAGDGRQECLRYSELLRRAPLDIVSLGIGENGHIAFNDPHEARFDDPETVKITTLDEPCRQQQVHDGEFADISLVPHQAMTLTIPALMSCRCAVGIVPLDRKAKAVHDALYGPISEKCPASILRTHDDAALFLDEGAASLLRI